MKTFTETKPFTDNPDFQNQRQKKLKKLDFNSIDEPIVDIIRRISELDFCYTLQSCYGHFVYELQKDRYNTAPLPITHVPQQIDYRLAYIAVCLEINEKGKDLFKRLKRIQSIDQNYIQFGCADWFWGQQANSFVLQVEPERFKYEDKIMVTHEEALHLEKIRNEFFIQLKNVFKTFSS